MAKDFISPKKWWYVCCIFAVLGCADYLLFRPTFFFYYFGPNCRNNVFIDTLDYCWLELLMKSNKVKNIYTNCY